MADFDLNAAINDAEATWPSDGSKEWFKIEEGDNRIRILTPLMVYPQHYNPAGYKGICLGKDAGCPGCANDEKPSIKWLCWVIDRKDGEVKLAKLPHAVAKQLQAYQNDPEYAFSEAPMPYDVTIKAKNAGTTDVEYNTVAGRTSEPVPEETMEELLKKTTPEDVKARAKEKKLKELGLAQPEPPVEAYDPTGKDYPTAESEGINPDNIPF